MTKLLVIGLDGVTFELIKPWMENGEMPNLKKLMETGTYGKLESTIPPLTYPAWTSIVTGKNPGKTGIFHFSTKEEGEYGKRIMGRIQKDRLWDLLGKKGKKSIVINVPGTYPVSEINGTMISCMMTPAGEKYTYPEKLQEELDNDEYEIDVDTKESWGNFPEKIKIDKVFNVTEKRMNAIRKLMKREEWEFCMLVFTGTDRLQHFFWHYIDRNSKHFQESEYEKRIHEYYKIIDNNIKEIIELAGEDTVVCLVSDHGFGPFYKSIHLNKWLIDNGYLESESKGTMAKAGITRSKIGNVVAKLGLTKLIPLVPNVLIKKIPRAEKSMATIQWDKTKAYALNIAGIYINLKGRDPNGIVEQKDYEKIRNEIKNKLIELIDPETNEKVIENVWKKEEVYSGENMGKIPDLLVETKEGYLGSETFSDLLFKKCWMSGTHKKYGIFIINGQGIKKNEISAKVYDVVPTLLTAINQPIPKDVDGKVLDVFTEKKEIKYEEPAKQEKLVQYTDDQQEKIKERLKQLGYLD